MDIIIKAGLLKGLKDTESINLFNIKVNDKNYIKVRKRLELEVDMAIGMLKRLRELGHIRSISMPMTKNKLLQKKINIIVNFKKTLKQSIEKIKECYYK